MKNEKTLLHTICICLLLLFASSWAFASEVTPDQFAGNDGLLDEKELIEFLLVHNKKSFQDVWKQDPSSREIANEGGNLEQAKKKKLLKWKLLEIKERERSIGPYTPQQIHTKQIDSTAKYTKPGLFGKPRISNDGKTKYGPIRLRKNLEDWDKKIDTVGGASISYSNNRIDKTETWGSQGSISYPIAHYEERINPDKKGPVSSELALLPSIQWEYASAADIENLTFKLPVYYSVLHNIVPNEDASGDPTGLVSWLSEFYFTSFYLTDFNFDGAMIGAELTYEPILSISGFKTGSWVKLFKKSDIAYLFRIIPGLNYSRVLSESSFIDREENDDMFAITSLLELRFKLFGSSSPWEIYSTYGLMYDLSGDSEGYSDKLETGSTWWFTENVGLDLKYQKGDVPLTNQEIDLVTLNLQLRL